MILIFFLLFIPIFLSIYLFIYKFINNRTYSKKNGIEIITRIIKSYKIETVFILNFSYSNAINFVKYQLKSKNLHYLKINNLIEFENFYNVYTNLYESKFIVFTNSIDLDTHSKYFKKKYKNLLVLNIFYDNSIHYFNSKIYTIKNLINELRLNIEYLNSDMKTLCISNSIIFNELEYAYDKQLIHKKSINNLDKKDYDNILIPSEYFLFKNNISSYLSKKSIFKEVYLNKKNNFFSKLFKIKEINKIFNGINDSYDFNPKNPINFNFSNNNQLFNFIKYSDNLVIYIDDNILLNRDNNLIIYDLKKIFKFNVIIDSIMNFKNLDYYNYILICNKDHKIIGCKNLLVYDTFNFKSLLNYVFSKTFELKINYIKDKKLFFNTYGNDILLTEKTNDDLLSKKLKKKLIWIQDVKKINIFDYLKIIKINKKIFVHFLINDTLTDDFISMLNQLNIKFIIYSKVKFSDSNSINSLSLNISQIDIKNLKEVVFQSNKGLLVYYN
jgi:hypothetical protein